MATMNASEIDGRSRPARHIPHPIGLVASVPALAGVTRVAWGRGLSRRGLAITLVMALLCGIGLTAGVIRFITGRAVSTRRDALAPRCRPSTLAGSLASDDQSSPVRTAPDRRSSAREARSLRGPPLDRLPPFVGGPTQTSPQRSEGAPGGSTNHSGAARKPAQCQQLARRPYRSTVTDAGAYGGHRRPDERLHRCQHAAPRVSTCPHGQRVRPGRSGAGSAGMVWGDRD